MNKLRDNLLTLFLAICYSFSFCWRHAKKETAGRIFVSLVTTILLYLAIQSTGLIINEVQVIMNNPVEEGYSLRQMLQGNLLWPIMFLLIVLGLQIVIGRLNWFYQNKWNHKLRFANQRELNDHRATLDVARFRSKEYDDLSKRIQELMTSWQTRIWFANEMFSLLTIVISFGLFGSSVLQYEPIYALVIVLFALPMTIMEFIIISKWWTLFQKLVPHHKERSVLEKPYHSTNSFVQALMFNQMPILRQKIDINVGTVLDEYDQIRKMDVRSGNATHLIALVGLSLVIIHAIWSTIAYVGEIGTLTIIIAASRTFQGNLEAIISLIADQWNNAKGVILIEKDFLGLKPVIKTEYPVIPKFESPPPIVLDRVSFSYPDTDAIVLKDISFSIEPNTKVAIVGKSGSGKSTIQALLMRHYDPTSGEIYAGNVNLRNIPPNEWSNIASALTQEYTVLERRIGEEIASSRLDEVINYEAVATSCRFANFEEVVESDSEGYDRQIGVEFGGRDFSGGEKQRLALARVHYRGTPILILDEPDAKLDPESAQKVIDQLFAIQGVTVIMITHHVSRAERCDKIIVMGKGEIVEQGTHQELMSLNGVYTQMHQKDRERLGGVES